MLDNFNFTYNPLIGCDDKPHSNDFLKSVLEESIKEERFEDSKMYHDELEKRRNIFRILNAVLYHITQKQ